MWHGGCVLRCVTTAWHDGRIQHSTVTVTLPSLHNCFANGASHLSSAVLPGKRHVHAPALQRHKCTPAEQEDINVVLVADATFLCTIDEHGHGGHVCPRIDLQEAHDILEDGLAWRQSQ